MQKLKIDQTHQTDIFDILVKQSDRDALWFRDIHLFRGQHHGQRLPFQTSCVDRVRVRLVFRTLESVLRCRAQIQLRSDCRAESNCKKKKNT